MIDLDIDIVNRLLGSYFDYYTILSKLAPPHIKSVLTAMRDYGIHFIIIPQNRTEITLELDALEVMDAGFVAVISDDTSFSLGPNHFDHEMLKGLVEKSSHAAIISTDASADIYDMLSSIAGTRQTGTLIVETMPEHEMQWADRIRSLSPYMPLFISTLHPKRMAKYVWPDMRDDASVARKHS